jgi:transposase-like protein
MAGQRRRRLDAGNWREVMRRFDAAGATVSEFCAREGVCESSFYRWRRRMNWPGGQGSAARSAGPRTLTVAPSPVPFIELGSLAGSSCDAGNGFELRLELGGGLVLQIVRR